MLTPTLKVLVVDDDKLSRIAHMTILKSLGCEVDIATDGYQALAVWKNGFDIIFTDIDMPGLSGVDVTKTIRSFAHNISVSQPVIIGITANLDVRTDCFAAGMHDVWKKPISKKQVEQIIAKLERRKSSD